MLIDFVSRASIFSSPSLFLCLPSDISEETTGGKQNMINSNLHFCFDGSFWLKRLKVDLLVSLDSRVNLQFLVCILIRRGTL